ncbi:MAG TPA: hypothetical protein VF624_00010 [Tepidisphaeraceae bacterium]|jgi:hypothetical protein
MRIVLSAPNTLGYPDGGHVWVFINWALGFRSLGHEVVWLDVTHDKDTPEVVAALLQEMRSRLAPFGLDSQIALCTEAGDAYAHEAELGLYPLEDALGGDLLCDHRYNLPAKIVGRFKTSMLVDIDPGQFHVALDVGTYKPAPHDFYFTVGEWAKFTHAQKAMFNTHGFHWQYTPPPVALDEWPVTPAGPDAAFTTVSNWFMSNEWMPAPDGVWYDNSKRAAFQDYLDLPRASARPMELCLNIGTYQPEIDLLGSKGWRIVKSQATSHPQDYRRYLQNSLAEFSCAKPAYVRMKTGWLSDRTVCYLASGKPVVIQKTGESDIFDGRLGMLRFETPAEAQSQITDVCENYDKHSQAARAIAEQHLDARTVLARVLERCY